MEKRDTISKRQLLRLVFLGVMSSGISLIPGVSVKLGGKASWLSPIPAFLMFLLYIIITEGFLGKRRPGEGLPKMILSALGKPLGKAVLTIYYIWIIFFSGLILRSSGERLLESVYEFGGLYIFIAVTLIVSVLISMGNLRALGRMGSVYSVIVLVILLFVFAFTMADVKAENLLPVTHHDMGDIIIGMVPSLGSFSVYGYFSFLSGSTDKKENDKKLSIKWMSLTSLTILIISMVTVGSLSSELAAKLKHPFFIAERNVQVLGTVERIEAFVVGFWIIADIILLASLFIIGKKILGSIVKIKKEKIISVFEGAAALVISLIIPAGGDVMEFLFEVISPLVNIFLILFLLPVIYFTGFLKMKIRAKRREEGGNSSKCP